MARDAYQDWFDGKQARRGHPLRRPEPVSRFQEPTPEEIQYSFADRVDLIRFDTTLRVMNIADLTLALTLFAEIGPDGRADMVADIGEAHGGMAAALLGSAFARGPSLEQFTQRVIGEAVFEIRRGFRYHKDFEFAPGPFNRGTVDITAVNAEGERNYGDRRIMPDETAYYEVILRTGSSNASEARIAQELDLRRGSNGAQVYRQWATPVGSDRFAVPLADIRLLCGISADELTAANLIPPDERREFCFTIARAEHYTVVLRPCRFRMAQKWDLADAPQRDAEIRIENDVLTGPAKFDDLFGRYTAMAFEVRLVPKREPVFDPQAKQDIYDAAQRIRDVLRP